MYHKNDVPTRTHQYNTENKIGLLCEYRNRYSIIFFKIPSLICIHMFEFVHLNFYSKLNTIFLYTFMFEI